MRWQTHRAIALFSYSTVIVFTNSLLLDFTTIIGVASAYWGATLPDKIEAEGEHRTYGHSICYALVLCSLFYLLGNQIWLLKGIAIGFICGVLTHLLSDAFTDNGISALWPIRKNRINPGRFRLWYYSQGERYEEIVSVICWVFIILFWIKLLVVMDIQL